MKNDYKIIKPMKEIPDQLRKLRRQFLRYQQAEIVYSLSHKKLLELASDAGAIYRFDSTVLINREIWNASMNLQEKLPWRRSRTSERQCVDIKNKTWRFCLWVTPERTLKEQK